MAAAVLARIDQARRGLGPLTPAGRVLLQSVIDNPTAENWRAGRNLIVGAGTLWQAVYAIDPAAANDTHIPTAFTVRRALARATTQEVNR